MHTVCMYWSEFHISSVISPLKKSNLVHMHPQFISQVVKLPNIECFEIDYGHSQSHLSMFSFAQLEATNRLSSSCAAAADILAHSPLLFVQTRIIGWRCLLAETLARTACHGQFSMLTSCTFETMRTLFQRPSMLLAIVDVLMPELQLSLYSPVASNSMCVYIWTHIAS